MIAHRDKQKNKKYENVNKMKQHTTIERKELHRTKNKKESQIKAFILLTKSKFAKTPKKRTVHRYPTVTQRQNDDFSTQIPRFFFQREEPAAPS